MIIMSCFKNTYKFNIYYLIINFFYIIILQNKNNNKIICLFQSHLQYLIH